MKKDEKQEMEKTIQTIKGDCEHLAQENASLKRQIGGFKTSNEKYKKQATNDALFIKSLQQDLAKCKKEAQDEVFGLHDTINEKDKVIVGLQNQAQEMSTRIKNMEANLGNALGERDTYKANYEHFLSLPWYKRIFAK